MVQTKARPTFRVLRVSPIRGRAFAAGEEHGEPLAVLSERLWRRLGGDPRVGVGASIKLDGAARTVIGVRPARISPRVTLAEE